MKENEWINDKKPAHDQCVIMKYKYRGIHISPAVFDDNTDTFFDMRYEVEVESSEVLGWIPLPTE